MSGYYSTIFCWSDESIAELKRLWCDQGVSASIAAQLLSEKFGGYLTRNSIIGKANRLGIKQPEKNIYIEDRKKKEKSVVKQSLTTQPAKIVVKKIDAPPSLPVEHVPVDTPDVAKRIGLLDLRETTCRFPIGDPRHEGFGYCGAESSVGKPYCAYHSRIAYEKPTIGKFKKKNGDHHGMRVIQFVAY